ncbi:permease prefix domain 1-containing protein [Enterococcus nangangensis]
METLQTYLMSLFQTIPETPEMVQLREDLLANLTDRYQELKDSGKSEAEAIGQAISEFGSLDELLAEYDLPQNDPQETLTLAEVAAYEIDYRKYSLYISVGILGACLGLGGMLILMRNDEPSLLGMLSFLLGGVLVVALCIIGGMGFHKINHTLNDRLISPEIQRATLEARENYQRSFVLSLVVGISLCILSLLPVFVMAFNQPAILSATRAAGLMFVIAGFGVCLIVYGGVNYGMYGRFIHHHVFVSDESELGPNAQKILGRNPKVEVFFSKVYWPLITLAYFIWSFTTHGWAYTWLIYPVAGILQEAIRGMITVSEKEKN